MLLLKNGKILDENGELQRRDILIAEKKIRKIEKNIDLNEVEILDLKGKLIVPGFVDVHVHLREPGFTHKETILDGTISAASGGYTTICAMPNTNPIPDSLEKLELVKKIISKDARVKVMPYVSITKNEEGEELVCVENFKGEGIIGFTDDGKGIQEAGLMYQAMKAAKNINKPIVAHCEDNSLLYGGYFHDGHYSKKNGHKGILSASESVQIARDIILAKETGVHYHICHISTKESVELVRFAKALGVNVTAEVTPHHLILSENDIDEKDLPNYKMNPPLRSLDDKNALINGLVDGTIDIIATDHAPHHEEEKQREISEAAFGIVGLETSFPLLYTKLVKENKMELKRLVECMSTIPAELFKIPHGDLNIEDIADLTIIDLHKKKKIDINEFSSKGKNSPFHGEVVEAWPVMTILEGEIVYRREV